ncbi:hypothetical protein CERSUDRAFT_98140 [Gelatoporia subvermispora B]|uniref:Uncharacterized protein n=1 Tax=Ceriporiopsis subvermispora (strain B) TaxID=914234 RepID=M2PCW8_CERS8|nr:hypothetical protein CERSUDRAFT_98140 [Gelatoporia subvermispora B]
MLVSVARTFTFLVVVLTAMLPVYSAPIAEPAEVDPVEDWGSGRTPTWKK